MSDAPYTADEIEMYKKYRKKLRDLPAEANTSDPTGIKFPISPKHFSEIYLNKNPNATYLDDSGQFIELSAHYGTTFSEKFASYLIVKDITDSLYNKTFMTALQNSGVVYDSYSYLKGTKALDEYTDAEKATTKDYLDKLIAEIEGSM